MFRHWTSVGYSETIRYTSCSLNILFIFLAIAQTSRGLKLQRLPIISVVIVVLSWLTLQGCSPAAPNINKISGPTMGTQYNISWVSRYHRQADIINEQKKIQADIDNILIDINKSMSTYDPNSELSQINAFFSRDLLPATNNSVSPEIGNWQPISAGLYQVLMMSMQIGIKSEGAFDVTVGPLVNLWGFGPQMRTLKAPAAKEITATLKQVGAAAINIRKKSNQYQLKLSAPRYIDLSAIAKGYAVDVIANYLKAHDIHGFLVEVGGEIAAHGTKTSLKSTDSSGPPWRIAIEAPSEGQRNAQLVIPLSNMAIATSGDYRNYFEENGIRFSHTIDGRTGYPIRHNLASVSVIHKSSAIADAWATALSVLGAEQGMKIANEHNLAALFIQRTAEGFEQSSSNQFQKFKQSLK